MPSAKESFENRSIPKSSSSAEAHCDGNGGPPVDDLLRVCSYYRRDFGRSVIWFPDHDRATATTHLLSNFGQAASPLGSLERLPIELINAIVLDLDLFSLLNLRRVNRRAREVVNLLREYKLLATRATNCLCAILRTKSSPAVTLSDLYDLFCQDTCFICGERFGGLFHLLKWKRCCVACLRKKHPESAVVTMSQAKKLLRLSAASMNMLPILKNLPGIYTMDETTYKRSMCVTSLPEAIRWYSVENRGASPPATMGVQPHLAFMSCCAFPFYDATVGRVQYGVSCAGCQLAAEKWRHDFDAAINRREMVYSRAAFLKHYKECGEAQSLWESSDNGTIEPPKLPYFCKQGGYFRPEPHI